MDDGRMWIEERFANDREKKEVSKLYGGGYVWPKKMWAGDRSGERGIVIENWAWLWQRQCNTIACSRGRAAHASRQPATWSRRGDCNAGARARAG